LAVDTECPGETEGFVALNVAVFRIVVPAGAWTLTSMVTRMGVRRDSEGLLQVTVLFANEQLAVFEHLLPLQVICSALACTKVTPAGRGSVIVTPVVACLPKSVAVIAYESLLLCFTLCGARFSKYVLTEGATTR
jgi:hypothetical protein